MEAVIVKKTANTKFEVTVGIGEDTTMHTVTLDKQYWQKLTDGKRKPEQLIERSFSFLLERESKESILRVFHLSDIQKYFPEYEREIATRL